MTQFPLAGGEWRLKYERAVREIDFTKKRLQQELEDKLEVEQQGKRQLERKVSGAQPQGPLYPLSMGMGSLELRVHMASGDMVVSQSPQHPACSCP